MTVTVEELMQQVAELEGENERLGERHDALIEARDAIDALAKVVSQQRFGNSTKITELMRDAVKLKAQNA